MAAVAGGDRGKQEEAAAALIEDCVNQRFFGLKEAIKDWEEGDFLQAVYEIIEKLNERSGSMQFRLPDIVKLRTAFKKAKESGDRGRPTEGQLKKIVGEVITLESFYVGQGARDVFLYIFGVPIAALLAKRVLPGPTTLISDEVFIPAVTSATVVYLAKTNRL